MSPIKSSCGIPGIMVTPAALIPAPPMPTSWRSGPGGDRFGQMGSVEIP